MLAAGLLPLSACGNGGSSSQAASLATNGASGASAATTAGSADLEKELETYADPRAQSLLARSVCAGRG